MRVRLALVLLVGPLAHATDLAARVEALLDESPVAQHGFVGLEIHDLPGGRTLVEFNAGRHFVPASNTKLFTTALGLVRLGPLYRFHTRVLAAAPPDAEGRVAGPLTLAGSGDPNLSGRALPYRVDAPAGNPLEVIEDLARQVVEHGVRRVEGDIVGDDTAFPWEPYAEGWGIDDPLMDYGAPVSALSIGDNTIALTVRPTGIRLDPPLEYYQIDSRVRLERNVPRRLRIERDPGSRQVRVWGALEPDGQGVTTRLAVDDPALYAAMALRDALTRRGVAVRGQAVARHAYPGDDVPHPAPSGVEVARRTSAPLVESLQVIDKVSQNLHAEMLFRAVALARQGLGTREAGLEELRAFLRDAQIEPEEYEFNDGSGLSRRNLVTPRAIVKLLRYMYGSPHREAWLSLLPVGGEDGTLRLRMRNTPAAGRIRAKTGTLSHVAALAGYAQRADGSLVAFAVLTNNQNAPSAEARTFIDKLCVLMVE